MKKVIILRGIPGSGKSTLVKENYADAIVCSADNYFEEVAALNGTDYLTEFDRRLVGRAHQHCWNSFIHALCVMGEEIIVVDNTNIHEWEYENYSFLAEINGYNVEIISIPANETPETYYERNTHGVTLDVIQRMMNEYEKV